MKVINRCFVDNHGVGEVTANVEESAPSLLYTVRDKCIQKYANKAPAIKNELIGLKLEAVNKGYKTTKLGHLRTGVYNAVINGDVPVSSL